MKNLLLAVMLLCSVSVFAQIDASKDKGKCVVTAEKFVKSKLKYPNTADFKLGTVHETDGFRKAIVMGKLTAKNAFSMETEYVYKIWMMHKGNAWDELSNWKLNKLVLENVNTGKQEVFDYREKPKNDTSVRKAGEIDGINCKKIESNKYFTRLVTAKKLTKAQVTKAAKILDIKTSNIYFHLLNKTNRGQEYASKTGDMIFYY